ncbi:hypothetical protein MMPV_005679 [Pyropia vietnamensis]
MPQRVLSTAAADVGNASAITITAFGRPLVTAVIAAAATATAIGLPEEVLSADAVHVTARKAMEPRAAAADPALRADDPHFLRDVMPALQGTMRTLLLRSWGVGAGECKAVLDGVIATELRRAVDAAAGSGGRGDEGVTVDLFSIVSRAVLRGGVAIFLGSRFEATDGEEVAAGMAAWQSAAFRLPWFLAPRWTRWLRPAISEAFERGYKPMVAHVARVMDGSEAAEEGTYLAALLQSLAGLSPSPPVTPGQVTLHIYGILVALRINTYATGAWAVAHVIREPELAAAATAEVDNFIAATATTGASFGGGAKLAPVATASAVTGLATMEAVWAEAVRMYFVTPSLRHARTPFVIPPPASPGSTSGGRSRGDAGNYINRGSRGGSGGGSGGRWTVPGDGRTVLLSILDINRGTAHPDGDTFVATRFLPPHGRRWRAAEADRSLYAFAWGPHACIGRRVAELALQRLWVGLLGEYTLALVNAPGRGGGGRGGHGERGEADVVTVPPPLPAADYATAFGTAVPVAPVWVRLTPRRRPSSAGVPSHAQDDGEEKGGAR